jgi:hypothetical protein
VLTSTRRAIARKELDLGGDLTYSERPVKILDAAERVTHSKVIKICNVQWSHCSHENSMAHVEQSEALSRKAKLIAFLFKATTASKTTKVKLRKLVDAKKEKCLIVCLLSLGTFTLGLYTQLDSYLFRTLQTNFYLFTTRLLDYEDSILLTLST